MNGERSEPLDLDYHTPFQIIMSNKENVPKEKKIVGSKSQNQRPFGEKKHDGLLNSRLKISYLNLILTKRADNSALYRVDMTKVAELEDMVKKNSEYQKLLQNKIKEMQMIEKRKEEERLSRESELVERLRELEEQSKDQVGGFFPEISCCLTLTLFLRVIAAVFYEVSSKWNSRLKRFK